ncbi:MAG: RNA-directed DNA polymerase [Sphingobacteriia bacterium]|jgi:RNA-directed DNA polymerase
MGKEKVLRKSILELTHDEARDFFLSGDAYFSEKLPPYFDFEGFISSIYEIIDKRKLKDLLLKKGILPSKFEKVNHVIYHNKDGKYAWRPLQLINPVLYILLVRIITEKDNWKLILKRFEDLKIDQIECTSMPVCPIKIDKKSETLKGASISEWVERNEQKSLSLALNYEYVLHTDIVDCYGSIYTHTIAWALHDKETAKENKNGTVKESLVGDEIDKTIQGMQHGQTNGIPQGSVLMDFIAEMVLAYADSLLEKELKKELSQGPVLNFRILRHRDDYRVFAQNSSDLEMIMRSLSKILMELGMKLNKEKTYISNNIISSSLKQDKKDWMVYEKESNTIFRKLISLHEFSLTHTNAGTIARVLSQVYKDIRRKRRLSLDAQINEIGEKKIRMRKVDIVKLSDMEKLCSILVSIMTRNSNIYSIGCAILSHLLEMERDEGKKEALKSKIIEKLRTIQNSGILELWLQRICLQNKDIIWSEMLTKKVNEDEIEIWNFDWVKEDISSNIKKNLSFIDQKKKNKLGKKVSSDEVEVFSQYN